MADCLSLQSGRKHFVTLFNKDYASRGLALYWSLSQHSLDFQLWVVALDDYTETLFRELRLESTTVISVNEIETVELQEKKRGRSFAEYCWTLTPFTFEAVFEREPSASSVTYVDADMWFAASPDSLVEAFHKSQADVLITEHAFHPAFDASATSGYFCVQFLTARRDKAKDILDEWKSQCLDWCFSYPDNGRFGDQGYLTKWPEKFGERVFIPASKEWFQGPWNALRFPYSEAMAYHFHSLNYLGKGEYDVGLYPIPKPHRKGLYAPYSAALKEAENAIRSAGFTPYGTVGIPEKVNALAHRLVRFREVWTTH